MEVDKCARSPLICGTGAFECPDTGPPGPSWSTRRWRRPSVYSLSPSRSCAASTKRPGEWNSTLGTSTGRSPPPRASSFAPAALRVGAADPRSSTGKAHRQLGIQVPPKGTEIQSGATVIVTLRTPVLGLAAPCRTSKWSTSRSRGSSPTGHSLVTPKRGSRPSLFPSAGMDQCG
jgi:hypothetical protein